MQERKPEKEKDLVDRSLAFIRSRTKETLAFGATGVGVVILGDKIDNDQFLEFGAAQVALANTLIGFSWGSLWLDNAIKRTIAAIDKRIEKNNKKKD